MEDFNFTLFEDYTKSVCRKIMSSKKKAEIREELYSHLLEEYDRNSALGFDDENAQNKAIEKMGDKDKLADAFGKIYSIIPAEYMRSSLNFIICGFFLSHFHIDFFEGFAQITTFLGEILLLFGLFKLRKTHKKINKALYLYVFTQITGIIFDAISYNLSNPTEFTTRFGIIIYFINVLMYWWIFSGLKNLCKTVLTDDDKKPHLITGFMSYLLFASIVIFAFLVEASELAIICPVFLIFSIVQLRRAKNVLAHDEPEFNLNDTLCKYEKIVYCVLVVILAITPIITMIGSSASNPDYEVFNPINTNISQIEVKSAKENMVKLGFPEEYLKDITDDEIIKYADATYLQTDEYRPYYREEYNFETNTTEKIVIGNITQYRFFFPDAEMRVLMRAEFPDEETCNYRNGLYLQFYDGDSHMAPKYTDAENNYGKYEIALAEYEGETIKTTPLSYYTDKNAIKSIYIAGFEFKFMDGSANRRAYVAHSTRISKPELQLNAGIDGVFFWEEIPLCAEYKSINSMAISEFDGIFTLGGNGFDCTYRWELYNSFSYDPSYIGKKAFVPDKEK